MHCVQYALCTVCTAAGGARGGWRRFWGGLYRLFGRNQRKGCQISTSRNSPADPDYPADPADPADPAEVVAAGVPQNLPSTRAGGQDDVSSNKLPQIKLV